ncbi:MAG: hypothetical protein NTW01_05575 [Gammaproteobacteria bacterium]|nr:hypothetical protein [Gammaproteobacteria bacterium]
MKLSDKEPHHELHAVVRAGFVAQRTSLHRWCAENGVCRPYCDQVLKGYAAAPKAMALRARLVAAAKVRA